MGLIDDIPTCDELISRIVNGAEELITERLGGMVTSQASAAVSA
jgi:nitronate monooxygenase